MNDCAARSRLSQRVMAAAFGVVAIVTATHWPSAHAETPPPAAVAAAAHEPVSWTFGNGPADATTAWTAERGRISSVDGQLRLQPDTVGRVVLLSPPALPDAVRYAETFVVGVVGTGLRRVRVQGRRDARGGWLTLGDASGTALQETADGFVVKRVHGARGAPIERLRVELEFRSTVPRTLTRIAAVPGAK